MTISLTTSRSIHNGSGSTGPFNIGFYYASSAEILVTKTTSAGAESTLTLTTDYTLTGAGTSSGTLLLITALASGETLTIERRSDLTQTLDLNRGGKIDATLLEAALDKLTRIVQDLYGRIQRSIEFYKDDAEGSGAFNARGNRISNLATPTGSTDAVTKGYADTIINTASASATAAAASATAASNSATAAASSATAAANSASQLASSYVAPGSSVLYEHTILDSLEASFNGVTTTFALALGGSSYSPASAAQLVIHLNGVYQEPTIAYTVSGSNITFTTAPAAGDECIILAMKTAAGVVSVTPTAYWNTVLTTAGTAADSRTQLGSGTTGDALFTAASSAAARTTLGTRTSALDAISASFNGATTTFNLTASAVAFTPRDVYGIQCVYNGVPQIPGDAFTVAGSQITFTFTPASGDSCSLWAVNA